MATTTATSTKQGDCRNPTFARRIPANIQSFFFPQLCLLCDNPRELHHHWLCDDCLDLLEANHIGRTPCPHCGLNPRVRSCTCEAHWNHPYESISAIFDYDDTVKRIMLNVKYRGRSGLARDLGVEVGHAFAAEGAVEADLLVPVPLHFFKKFQRGYNQSEMLARGIAESLGGHLAVEPGIIVRKRYTKTQTRLDRSQRDKNLRDAFVVPPGKRNKVSGKTVLLIDDVVTTGATTGACAQALKDAGAKAVRVLCLARD